MGEEICVWREFGEGFAGEGERLRLGLCCCHGYDLEAERETVWWVLKVAQRMLELKLGRLVMLSILQLSDAFVSRVVLWELYDLACGRG